MPVIQSSDLERFATAVMTALGSNDDESRTVAHHLVEANLKGHDSHGIGMIPTYVPMVKDGLARCNQAIGMIKDRGPVLVIDGGRGFGQRVGRDAIRCGIATAKQDGAAILALRNTSHLGRIGTYGEQTARAGLISIHFVNVADHPALQAVHGGSDARLGTNPFCAAVPDSDGQWTVLDMATSSIALGKARVARNQGVPLPEDCMIDGTGRPTLDPKPMVDHRIGALLPFGGHKGSGLAIICELLAGALTGGTSIQPANPRLGGIINNMLSIIIDPAATGGASAVLDEVSAIRDWIKASPPAPGTDAVLMPGEPEQIAMAVLGSDGIAVDDTTAGDLIDAAVAAGISRDSAMQMLGLQATGGH